MPARTLTDTTTISWDEATAGQVKGNVNSDSVTNALLVDVDEATIKGRPAGAGTGDPVDLTQAQAKAVLGLVGASTDEAIVRFNGTDGDTQNSGVTIDDSNNVAGMASLTLPNTGLHLLDPDASHDLIIAPGSNLSADRTLTVTTGDANRTLTLSGDAALNQNLRTADSPTFVNLTQTGYHELTEIAEPAVPAADVGRLYAADNGGVTTLFFKDSAGRVTNLFSSSHDFNFQNYR